MNQPPLCTWSEPVLDEWIDYNGHLSEPYYVLVLGHATDAVMDTVGLGPAYRETSGASLYTVEAHVRYLDQVGPGEQLEVRSWVIGATGKLLARPLTAPLSTCSPTISSVARTVPPAQSSCQIHSSLAVDPMTQERVSSCSPGPTWSR